MLADAFISAVSNDDARQLPPVQWPSSSLTSHDRRRGGESFYRYLCCRSVSERPDSSIHHGDQFSSFLSGRLESSRAAPPFTLRRARISTLSASEATSSEAPVALSAPPRLVQSRIGGTATSTTIGMAAHADSAATAARNPIAPSSTSALSQAASPRMETRDSHLRLHQPRPPSPSASPPSRANLELGQPAHAAAAASPTGWRGCVRRRLR